MNGKRESNKNPLLDIALELERVALEDEYFIERNLYPNVDFYSGIIYQAIGFPVDMFPALFAIPRTAGWLAQWQEMLDDSDQRIARPPQVFTGYDTQEYVPIAKRCQPRLRAMRCVAEIWWTFGILIVLVIPNRVRGRRPDMRLRVRLRFVTDKFHLSPNPFPVRPQSCPAVPMRACRGKRIRAGKGECDRSSQTIQIP